MAAARRIVYQSRFTGSTFLACTFNLCNLLPIKEESPFILQKEPAAG